MINEPVSATMLKYHVGLFHWVSTAYTIDSVYADWQLQRFTMDNDGSLEDSDEEVYSAMFSIDLLLMCVPFI